MLPNLKLPRVDVGLFGFGAHAVKDPDNTELERDWRAWLKKLFPHYFPAPFAPHHEEFWKWLWAVEPGERPQPQVNVWARGHAKSTNAEAGVVALGARSKKKYVLYVSGTQDQADDHVANIGDMLESPMLSELYPSLAAKSVNKYGHSQGWRRNRLRSSSGFTVDAIGLDTAARGRKLEEDRPDFMVLDDLDEESDSPHVTRRKIRALTRKLLPAGATDLAVLAVQNLVHTDSIFSRLVDGRADFLAERIVSGPIPAIRDLEYDEENPRLVINSGVPTWEGMDLARCQEIADDEGKESFLVERQHSVEIVSGHVFPGMKIKAAEERAKLLSYDESLPTYAGLDWGYTAHTALEVCQENADDAVHWFHESLWKQTELNQRCREIAEVCERYNVRIVFTDAAGATENRTLAAHFFSRGLETAIKPVPFGKFKTTGIAVRRWYLQYGREAVGTPQLAQDSKRYRYKEDKEEPEKGDDHTVDAATAFYASRRRVLGKGE